MITEFLHSSQWCYQHKLNRLGLLFEKLMVLTCSAHISGKAKIHKSVSFSHSGIGVIVNPASEIGEDCIICPKVTLGNRYPHSGAPKYRKNVLVGLGAYLGGGMRVCDNVKVGAHSVVLAEFSERCAAMVNPARIIHKTN